MDYRSDIANMRRDALRRTREMHRQNTGVQHDSGRSMPESVPLPEEKPERTAEEKISAAVKQKANQNSGLNGLLSGIFSGGRPDSDKIIIIALILILAGDGADLKLLIALGYILM